MLANAKVIFQTLFFFSLIFADQLSKYLIRHLGGFYICNQNIAFGLKIPTLLFWLFWLLIIVFILFLLKKKHPLFNSFSLLIILAGALSNILDRFIYDCIIDFVDLKIWPAFNLADSFITLGVIFLLFSLYKEPLKSSLTKKT